jgi:hypothetical protein
VKLVKLSIGKYRGKVRWVYINPQNVCSVVPSLEDPESKTDVLMANNQKAMICEPIEEVIKKLGKGAEE